MKRFLIKAFAAVIGVLAMVGSVNLGIWVADTDAPIEYENVTALADSVEQGGTIEVEFSVFRKRICPLVAKRWLLDANKERHSIPQYTTGLKLLAGRETYCRSITIPPAVAPGPAEYSVKLDYICNPLHNLIGPIRVVSPGIRFTILPAGKPQSS